MQSEIDNTTVPSTSPAQMSTSPAHSSIQESNEEIMNFQSAKQAFPTFESLIEYAKYSNMMMKMCGFEPLKYSN